MQSSWFAFAGMLFCGCHLGPKNGIPAPKDGGSSPDSVMVECGGLCSIGQLCCEEVCVEAASCDFAVIGADPSVGWHNGGNYVTLKGSGFTAGMKVFIGDARAPVLVKSATAARIQLPPGPLGKQDIRIELGADQATLPRGILYQSGGLNNQWEQKPLMKVRGENPGVTTLQDGRVLVAGGVEVPDQPKTALNTAELYHHNLNMVSPAKNTMSTVRWQNAVVTLLDGRALVMGGACWPSENDCTGDLASADLFDPTTDTFKPTHKPLNKKRVYVRAVLLVDGRVLLSSANDPSLEVFDPATDEFTLLPHPMPHDLGFMVRLRDGRVLLGGGDGGNTKADLFDPDTLKASPTAGKMQVGRAVLTAHTLPDGRVLLIGGTDKSAMAISTSQKSLEIFDPNTNSFSPLGYSLTTARSWHASALVRDGTVLVMGGYSLDGCAATEKVEQIDPVAGKVLSFSSLKKPNTEFNAVTLLDGSVLAVGGGACLDDLAKPDLDFLSGGPG